jgi:hypothetical protein
MRYNQVRQQATETLMDDDTFKRELLRRLDQIVELLSLSCNLTEACIEEAPEETYRQSGSEGPTQNTSDRFQIKDEMQENYLQAYQKWMTKEV